MKKEDREKYNNIISWGFIVISLILIGAKIYYG